MSNIGYGSEEESRTLKTMSNGGADLFRKENESLDLLLREMKQDPSKTRESEGDDSVLYTASPVRPLKFTMPKSESLDQDRGQKEFNSSSDTYTTDAESPKEVKQQLESSFERNFDLEEPGQIHKTISNVSHRDEFSFTTPTSSTADLLASTSKRASAPASPCKSIMKKSATSSPKKNVVFTSSNPEVHHYPDADNSLDYIPKKPVKINTEHNISHGWSKLERKISSDEESSTPPAPPPRTSSTFDNLLSKSEDDSLDKHVLATMKLRSSSFNNLSLNEKLDFFLTRKENTEGVDLDQHLKRLEEANQSKIDSNIHGLSLNLITPRADIENPLESLAKDSEVQLRSSGSSQSSLQSLVESNRKLNYDAHRIVNRGLELNNGLKGYSDEVINTAIPITNEGEKAKEGKRNSINRASMISTNTSDGEIFHDSFDTSYNNTEQSIMKLLVPSSSQQNIEGLKSNNDADSVQSNRDVNDNKRIDDEPTEQVQNITVKLENDFSNVEAKRDEPMGHTLDPETFVKTEATNTTLTNPFRRTDESGSYIPSQSVFPKDENESENYVDKEADTSIPNDSAQFSLRLDMDSEWKLEDSNDGDREDNDDYTNADPDVTVVHASTGIKSELEEPELAEGLKHDASARTSVLSSPSFEDASDEISPAESFAIKKSEESDGGLTAGVDLDHQSKSWSTSESESQSRAVKEEDDDPNFDSQPEEHEHENVLANSSNIAPPEEITLPPIEVNNYSSFDELTKNLNESNNSYEESLSAEHDEVKAPVNYISIWHSQEKSRKHSGSKSPKLDIAPPIDYESSTPKIPHAMKTKKFKEVSVTSRKLVNPDFEELHVTGFLPELSDDSGFASHFNNAKFNTSHIDHVSIAGNRRSETPLSVKNVLANIDNTPDVPLPPSPKQVTLRPPSSTMKKEFLRPGPPTYKNMVQKRSKFRVPSVDIHNSDIISSPMDQYNEIFDDVLGEAPTIKSHGMKTLPSMDRDDVKRILSTKRMIMQEEYSNLKYVGCETRKKSVVTEPVDKFDELSQHASIYDISPDASPRMPNKGFSHLATELVKEPSTLKSKEQIFGENAYDDDDARQYLNSVDTSLGSIPNNVDNTFTQSKFPDPDPDLFSSPDKDSNIFKTPPKAGERSYDEFQDAIDHPVAIENPIAKDLSKIQKVDTSPSPRRRNPPIKIGSPVRLVKQGGSVTGIEIPPTIHSETRKSFDGGELNNTKLRTMIPSDVENAPKKTSTINIPSGATNKSKVSEASSSTLPYSEDAKATVDSKSAASQQERGRLFFRVVGLKNLNLPDIKQHRGSFSLTLDNGVHCIKTPNYNIEDENVSIGKEFELLVGDSLEFIMTLKMNYEKPKDSLREVKEKKVVKSKNRLSRLFGSKDIITSTKFVPIEVKDSWRAKFAQDGSFGRCYVDLAQYEDKIKGQISTFNLNCFNEWETATGPNGEVIRYRPYNVGKLEVKMLFVPRTSSNELLPNSIRSAQESISELQHEQSLCHEGYLDQDGGDCDSIKRRFFKLQGTSLIAHSEFSHKTRAKINLAKVIDIIYLDRENYNSKNYRNFSDVLLLENSFKIKFANGEVIDFGAPNKEEKSQWISIIESIIHRNKFRRLPWVQLMLEQAHSE